MILAESNRPVVHTLSQVEDGMYLISRQISAVPDLCCIVTWRLVESVVRVFDPLLSSAI